MGQIFYFSGQQWLRKALESPITNGLRKRRAGTGGAFMRFGAPLHVETMSRDDDEGDLTVQQVAAGVACLRMCGHIETERTGRCWIIRIARKLIERGLQALSYRYDNLETFTKRHRAGRGCVGMAGGPP
jgi:hypothetical protein